MGMIVNGFGATCKLQSWWSFVQHGRRYIADNGCPGVASQRGTQNVGELAVTEVDKSFLLAKLFDDQTESGQTGVDGTTFTKAVTSSVGLGGFLGTSKINCDGDKSFPKSLCLLIYEYNNRTLWLF